MEIEAFLSVSVIRGELLSNARQISWINFAAFCQYLFNPHSAKGTRMALPLRWKSCACAAGVFELPSDATNARAYGRTHPRVAVASIGIRKQALANNP
jgi:hypothetical protein